VLIDVHSWHEVVWIVKTVHDRGVVAGWLAGLSLWHEHAADRLRLAEVLAGELRKWTFLAVESTCWIVLRRTVLFVLMLATSALTSVTVSFTSSNREVGRCQPVELR